MSPELKLAMATAREAGALLRESVDTDLDVNEAHAHDIKLALDVKSQNLIESRILEAFPDHAIYGEEGIAGDQTSDTQWIVDPIDGTVNFFYGLPHFCVSIAMRREGELKIGAIYDPSMDEMFGVDFEGPATRNGEPIRPSVTAQRSQKQSLQSDSPRARMRSKLDWPVTAALPTASAKPACWGAPRWLWPT